MVSVDVAESTLPTLARRLEDHQRSYAAIWYGSIFRVGVARVVLNPDSPLAASNFAATLTGDPDEGEPGRLAVPAATAGELAVADVLVDAFGYSAHVEAALPDLVGQRLDDPRVVAVGAHRDGDLAAVALAFRRG